MSLEVKRKTLELVRRSPLPKRSTLKALKVPRSTYYRWQRRFRAQGEVGLVNRRPTPRRVWNRLRGEEERVILGQALNEPDRSPRELACWCTDQVGFSVSESTVYRVLKRHGLIKEVKLVGFPAGKEYRVKPHRVNEQWQSDASYFFVVGWGWYYLISVLDDFSRYILAWDLKSDMTCQSISEVIQQAVEWTGLESVPVEKRSRLLTDRGSSYLARPLEEYLKALSIRHIYCSPHHPQTQGKLERFHETLKARMNLLVYTSPGSLRTSMAEFIEFYNHRRYHEGIGNVTPADVYFGRREEILKRREVIRRETIRARFLYNRSQKQGEREGHLSDLHSVIESQWC